MNNPFSLLNKTILISGASSGIGKAIAIECSKMGAKVIIIGRNEKRLEDTFQQLDGCGHEKIIVDLNEKDAIKKVVDIVPLLNGIVHSAGITKNIPFTFATKENMDEVFNINFFIPAEMTRALLKSKKIEKQSSIVFISSVSGIYCSAPAASIYSASKGAINGLIKGMALDLASKNIRVNSVNPGVIETPIFDQGLITQEQLEENKKQYPLKRFGKPEEVAYAAIYLLSNASEWVTGINLLIDGGLMLQ